MIRKLAAAAVLVALGASLGGTRVVQASDSPSHVIGFWTDPAMSRTTGGGWLVTNTGTVTPVGAAPSYGQLGAGTVADVVGLLATPDGGGYWLAGSDGGVFSFGDAHFRGSLPGRRIVPDMAIAGIASCGAGDGYVLVQADGGWYPFGCGPLG
jgi:hypothetical protein